MSDTLRIGVSRLTFMVTSRLRVAPHRDLLAANRGGLEGRDDVVGERFRDFYITRPVADLDRAEQPRLNARFACDRAHEIGRPDAGLPAGADVEANRPAIGWNRA